MGRALTRGLLASGLATLALASACGADDGPRSKAAGEVATKRVSQPLLWPQLDMLAAPNPVAYMRFAAFIDIDDGTPARMIAGAPTGGQIIGQPGTDESRPGQAFIFQRVGNTWMHEATLHASDRFEWDEFGSAVAIDGNRAIVGAVGEDAAAAGDFVGAAYYYEYDGANWVEREKLIAGFPADGGFFGKSVGLDGDRAIISAYKSDFGGNDVGSAYIFEYNGTSWGAGQMIEASDKAENDQFGLNCRISGDYAVVGAFRADPLGNNSGAVYIYERQGPLNWVEAPKIVPSDLMAGDLFGVSVSIDGDLMVAGANRHDDGLDESGAAYVYRREGPMNWVLEQKLQPSDRAMGDNFGANVAISGDWIIVGASRADGSASDTGAVYMFERQGTTWVEDRKVTPVPEQADGTFGIQVNIDSNLTVVSAWQYDNPDDSGRAFVFEGVAPVNNGDPCTEDQRCGSGNCEDGVCCDSACGECQACVQSKTGQPDGTCAPIPAGEDPDNDCTDPTCTAGVQTGSECSGAGACDNADLECSPYICQATNDLCRDTCASDADCASEAFCDMSTNLCRGNRALGDACTRDDQCASSNCVDGVCCNSTCSGQCEACNETGTEGTCVAVEDAPRAPRMPCVDNGDACAGRCDGNDRSTCTYPGTTVTCDTSTCSSGDEQPFNCDSAGACVQGAIVECGQFACEDPGGCRTDCTGDDECASGFVCGGSGDCVPEGRCTQTTDCDTGFYCDRNDGACKRASGVPGSLAVGCVCEAPGSGTNGSNAPWALVLAAAAVGALRRRRS